MSEPKIMTKEELDRIKLSADESQRLNEFIGRAVRTDTRFTILTKKPGVSPIVGIQEVYNSGEDTIDTYAGLLNEQAKGHTGSFNPRSAEKVDIYMAPGTKNRVTGAGMVEILSLVLREKVYLTEMRLRAFHLASLKDKLAAMATPEEQKEELKKRITELENAAI